MKAALILLLLPIAGCAGIAQRPTSFGIPIQVKCEAKEVLVPSFALDDIGLDASDFALFDALVVERLQRIAYEIELVAAVKACQ